MRWPLRAAGPLAAPRRWGDRCPRWPGGLVVRRRDRAGLGQLATPRGVFILIRWSRLVPRGWAVLWRLLRAARWEGSPGWLCVQRGPILATSIPVWRAAGV
ncbi:hypothetical protein GCM10025762_10000 [Haloechinothrix salitolerans]